MKHKTTHYLFNLLLLASFIIAACQKEEEEYYYRPLNIDKELNHENDEKSDIVRPDEINFTGIDNEKQNENDEKIDLLNFINTTQNEYYNLEAFAMQRLVLLDTTTTIGIDSSEIVLAEYWEEIYEQAGTLDDFNSLADSTGGESLNLTEYSALVPKIISILTEKINKNTNLVFLIDYSGSMNDDIFLVKNDIDSILLLLPPNVNMAIATYRDINFDYYWYNRMDNFTTNHDEIREYVYNILPDGGGANIGESVYDALYKTINEFKWNENMDNVIIVIGDEPPLIGESSTYTFEDIVEACTSNYIKIKLFAIVIGNKFYSSSI